MRADFDAGNHAVGSVMIRLCALSSTSCWTGAVSRSFWAVARPTWITYADILPDLEPLNEGREKRDRITYDSLWIHAKRHYDMAGTAAYWRTRMSREFRSSRRPWGDSGL